mgnify:CR=1 FL=1
MYFLVFGAYIGLNFIALEVGGKIKDATNWGYLVCANGLFLAVPATRNSILVLLLGLPFDKALLFHRWLGRWITFCVSMHCFLFWDQWTEQKRVIKDEMFNNSKNLWGVLAWFCSVIIFITSLNYLRRRFFEYFYYSHFMFIAFYVFGWLHTEEFTLYAVLALVLYGLDRVYRLLRGNLPQHCSLVQLKPGNVVQIRYNKTLFAHRYKVGQYGT